MNMSIPKLCIVGAGILSSFRIYPYIGAAGAKIVGVCDLDAEKARKNAELFGGEVFTNMETMLDAVAPDGVIICIGPEAHSELALKVIVRGIPVYTEKPPAVDAASTLAVARAARVADVLCMTAFKKRYSNAARRAKEWIGGKEILTLSMDRASGKYSNANPRNDLLLDFGIHGIDLMGFLMGDARDVMAYAKGLEAYAVCVKFASGAVGTLSLSDGRAFDIPTEEIELTAAGGNFMSIHNSSSWKIGENGRCTEWREPPTFVSTGDSGYETGHLAELEYFVRAVAGGAKTAPSEIYESYKTMVLYEAIKKSAATETPVRAVYEAL